MIQRALKYLSSIWGALSAAAVLFPGAALLLSLSIAPENSKIAGLYPALATSFSAFSVIFLTSYSNKLTNIDWTRKISLIAVCVAAVFFLGFIVTKTIFVERKERVEYTLSNGNSVIVMKDHGEISYSETVEDINGIRKSVKDSIESDPFDIVQLICFIFMIVSLTVSFASLGLSSFYRQEF